MPTVKEIYKRYFSRFFFGFLMFDDEQIIEKAKTMPNVERFFQLLALFVKRRKFFKFLKLANIIAKILENKKQSSLAKAIRYKKIYLYYFLRKEYKKI